MPIYEYRCAACGFQKEYLQKMSDAPLKDCPECGKASLAKMVTAAGFHLKGSGWYATDFKTAAKPKTDEKTESKPDAKAKAEGSAAAKGDDKTAAKPEGKAAQEAAPAKKTDAVKTPVASNTGAGST